MEALYARIGARNEAFPRWSSMSIDLLQGNVQDTDDLQEGTGTVPLIL